MLKRRALWLPILLGTLAWNCRGAAIADADSGTDADAPDIVDPGDASDASDACLVVGSDTPCATFECLDPIRYATYSQKECTSFSNDPDCCSGQTCIAGPPGICAEGSACLGDPNGLKPCKTVECGRPSDPACPDGAYCDLFPGDCATTVGGTCASTPVECPDDSARVATDRWACGCDGKSYENDCKRQAASTARAAWGPCCDPSRLLLDREHPEQYPEWVACGEGSAELAATSIHLGTCFQGADAVARGCQAGEWACTDSLRLDVVTFGTRIPDYQWTWLCQLTGLPGVRRVTGRRCPDACGPGTRCLATWPTSGIACQASCEAVEVAWERQRRPCQQDADCRAVRSLCGMGLQGCWEAARRDATDADLDALSQPWSDAGCFSSPCECMPFQGTVKCQDNVCGVVPL